MELIMVRAPRPHHTIFLASPYFSASPAAAEMSFACSAALLVSLNEKFLVIVPPFL